MVNQPMGNHGLGIFWCGQIGWLVGFYDNEFENLR